MVQRAFQLEWVTIIWMMVETAVAIGAGIAAHSLLLFAFGTTASLRLSRLCVLIWRLSVELRRGRISPKRRAPCEPYCRRSAFALALYVVAAAAWGLWQHQGAEFSTTGLILTVAAIPIMYVLSRQKLALAEQLESWSLRADAIEEHHLRLVIFRCRNWLGRSAGLAACGSIPWLHLPLFISCSRKSARHGMEATVAIREAPTPVSADARWACR